MNAQLPWVEGGGMASFLMDGNESIARAALFSGCRFYAGYPITPASSISDWMLKLLPPIGGIFLQTEDEIAAIGHCLGAAMAGEKAMTATSGPGISLISEHVSFAVGSEIPIVIVNVQRLGPSTGSPTHGADGDIQFMRWGSSGGIPVIVLASCDVIDCYELTCQAFNLAERYRCPVFLASNKEVGMTLETFDFRQVHIPQIIRRRHARRKNDFKPFFIRQGESVPDFLPIGGETLVRQTSSTHGPDGFITVNPWIIEDVRRRLHGKTRMASLDAGFFEQTIGSESVVLVVAYGVTARAAKVAATELIRQGYPVSLLVLKMLYPVLENQIRRAADGVDRVLVIEMNLGQYVQEIERILPEKRVTFWGQMNGELITPNQIKEAIINDRIA